MQRVRSLGLGLGLGLGVGVVGVGRGQLAWRVNGAARVGRGPLAAAATTTTTTTAVLQPARRALVTTTAGSESTGTRRAGVAVATATALALAAGLGLGHGLGPTAAATTTTTTTTPEPRQKNEGEHHAPPQLFAGTANADLAASVASHLGVALGRAAVGRFADGEVSIQILDNVRGRDVYVLQSMSPPVNESLVELLLMVTTLRRASANRITAVIPYFAFTRPAHARGPGSSSGKDGDAGATPIAAADVANMLVVAGVDHVVIVDVHHTQTNGFFGRIPVDDLDVVGIAAPFFKRKDLIAPVVVAPGHDAVGRAKRFRDELIRQGVSDAGLAVVVDQRRRGSGAGSSKADMDIERSFELVGDVAGKDCIVRDDISESGYRLTNAAARLKRAGARRVFGFVTHPLMTPDALKRIDEAEEIVEVVCMDTIPKRGGAHPQMQMQVRDAKVAYLSIAPLLAETIKRLHANQSVSEMYLGGSAVMASSPAASAAQR